MMRKGSALPWRARTRARWPRCRHYSRTPPRPGSYCGSGACRGGHCSTAECLNVGHPPEDHGQVGRAEVQEVEEAEPQRQDGVTQHLALAAVPLMSAFHLLLELILAREGVSCFQVPAHLFMFSLDIRLYKSFRRI